jgi:hypothetical protein
MSVVTLKRLKYIVTAVAVELDEEGNVIGEQTTQPQAFYSAAQIIEFVDTFEASLTAESNGAAP